MRIQAPARRLTVYIGETDRWQGQPLYHAIVLKARELGLAGATVYRGIEGYGANSRVHAARVLELSADLPVIVEIVDHVDRLQPLLAFLDEAVQEGLVVLEDVEIVAYRKNRQR
ncbi:DUF190 domain-containing protein [Thermaerobacter subterraneus]|uniref:DUF190 domain-containing protein n=1 Tax=Thermaerobacter subterraneus DSM 13965 TaxID=867903 RepID=K6Q333_9FIRM|nr:DUF190 domain-containing protein [Thermaerobacter subterraneus]EKP95464.1 hypothetical protein ThesuDRAFT_01216 [Thermaerobacter subterraneus DSM 13965]